MKRFLLLILALFMGAGLYAQNNVTFSVDMNDYIGVGFTNIYVSGTFNGWSGDGDVLTDPDGDSVWTTTLSIADGDYEFKYSFDNWVGQEELTVGDPCTITTGNYTNRVLTVAGAPVDMGVVCWNTCNACGAAVDGDVTFSVDMNEYVGAVGQVYVSGVFNDWSGDANPLDDTDGDGVWEVTLPIAAGDYEFKYTMDNWTVQETLAPGGSCTITTGNYTNRVLSVNGNQTMPTVCWESCDACGFTQDMVAITFNVNMSEYIVDPGGVFVAGGAGFGSPGDNELTDPDGDGIYSGTVMRPVGFTSNYTFLNGNCPDYSCKENIAGQPCADPDNFNDRLLPAVAGDTVINTCYQECTDDTNCTPSGDPLMITFSVDMNQYVGAFTTVYVSGTFNGWAGDANPMDDMDGDGIWTTTIPIAAGTIEYKFTLDNWTAQEMFMPGGLCTVTNGNYTNRVLDVMDDITLPEVCWESCDACGVVGDMITITFMVNMIEYPADPGGVFVAGGAGFGVAGDNELTDPDGDGIYTGTVTRPQGFSSNFTFLNGNCPDWSCKENIAGQACADAANFNDRFLPPTMQDTTIMTCFQECTDDTNCTPLAMPTMVTFQVDMVDQVTSADGVYLGASFDGWTGGILMEDPDGDDIWTYTAEIQPGPIEYKFINGADWCCDEMFAGGESCTLTTGNYTNRFFEVGADDVMIDVVCFQSCDACSPDGVNDPIENNLFRLAPSHTNGAAVMLYFDEPSTDMRTVRVTNTIGQVVSTTTVSGFETQHAIEPTGLSNGLYFVIVEIGKQQAIEKFIVSK